LVHGWCDEARRRKGLDNPAGFVVKNLREKYLLPDPTGMHDTEDGQYADQDWNCPACDQFNFASERICRHCGCERGTQQGDWDDEDLDDGPSQNQETAGAGEVILSTAVPVPEMVEGRQYGNPF